MILVTGATGFLGKRICKKLDERGIDYIKTSLTMGTDMRDERDTMDLFKKVKPRFVLNCAAFLGGVQFGYEHAAEMFDNNIKMEVNLLNACKEVEVQRLINPIGNCSYPGEASTYREAEFWDGEIHDSVKAYGLAKKAFCVGSWAYNKQYGMETINLVLPNMYGPGDHFDENRSHAVGALIKKFVCAKKNNISSVVVWGTGKPIREWLYIDDAAEAMIRAMNMNYYNNIINIGIGKGISIYDTAIMLKDITGYNGNIVFDETKIDGALCKIMDSNLCKQIFDWVPQMDFRDGLKKTVNWYEENYIDEYSK